MNTATYHLHKDVPYNNQQFLMDTLCRDTGFIRRDYMTKQWMEERFVVMNFKDEVNGNERTVSFEYGLRG
jgi:C4-type Zn-finger protein